MQTKSYHTIDPLILQTLNINEQRLGHLFEILNSKDPKLYQSKKGSSKLPKIIQDYNRSKSPRQISERRAASVSMMNSPISTVRRDNEEELQRQKYTFSKKQNEYLHLRPQKRPMLPQKNPSIQERINQFAENKKILADSSRIHRNKTMELHPKDVYRIQIQHLVSQPLQIDQMEESQKLMKRLKRRYQHLRKFDRKYYLHLNRNDLLAV